MAWAEEASMNRTRDDEQLFIVGAGSVLHQIGKRISNEITGMSLFTYIISPALRIPLLYLQDGRIEKIRDKVKLQPS